VKPLIYAHRGASADFTEMSMEAYIGAIDQGADGFECDVRLSADNELVLWHDDDLQRVAHSPLKVAEATYAELKKECAILTVEDLLNLAIKYKKNIAFETKHPVPSKQKVERLLTRYLTVRKPEIDAAGITVTIMSFSWWAVQRIMRSPFPSVQLVWNDRGLKLNRAGIVSIEMTQIREDHSLVERLKSQGKRVYVWTVNEEVDAELAHQAGVDVIITDKPAVMRKTIEGVK
jgi:glycerophosphoryl diester phosphodiesterase